MFNPVYGEYYTGRDVTVNANYATTTEARQVAHINDRRQTPLEFEYRVLWVHPDRSCKRLYLCTWESRGRLAEDDFKVDMDLVDRWKASKFDTFEEFWKQGKVGFGLLGADEERLCLFDTLKGAAQLARRPDVITQQYIDQFRDELLLYQRDLSKVGHVFLDEIGLNDGIYIVAAYNHSFVGHGFVLTVQGKMRLIYYLQEGKPIASAEDWVNIYAFVRPFVIFK
ncbi:hypothetical protein PF010_g12202 [Phytophthora fragariae]|uniref:Uncharacterized protein n=1 Tax=Phytophthora fragariae TaxID=53985 RepID=A0A6G0NWX5_9STRA|nr:hypothetical protein PF003_g20757 [Phytophthora fragariae]KAE9107646.1 hypothetical protein PF010_g12202 [Phytophthora fragariae]KAE9225834.1 hypothetical protein PF004_g11824 [Phytophthora fragariae]